jgi:uracil-DNA glycosylase family 4
MSGFFTRQETQSTSRPNGQVHSCARCGLHKQVNTPRMKPYGDYSKPIIVIGDAPSKIDDDRGKPWQDKTGRLLQKTLKDMGIDLFKDCLSVNACFCSPLDKRGEERTPTNYEVDSCRRHLLKIIQEHQPQLIILLGPMSVYSLLGHRWERSLGGIMKWRGWTIPDRDFKAWICPTFHPSYVSRGDKEAMTIWKPLELNPMPKGKELFVLLWLIPMIMLMLLLCPKERKTENLGWIY